MNHLKSYNNNIKENALHGLGTGIQIATSVVASTMGAKGLNVCIQIEDYPYALTTNDGATIIDHIQLEDPLEKQGLQFLKEAVARSNSNAGDGSTTTCVLLNSIIQEGIASGVRGLEIKDSLDELLPIIIEELDKQKKRITPDEVESVAKIAGESESLAKILGEIYKQIGKDGIIHLESSETYDSSYQFIEGVRFGQTGYLSPYLVHDEQAIKENRKETKAIYQNPTILVTKKKINSINDIDPLIQMLVSMEKKDLVIFTDDMDSNVASLLIKAHRDHVFNILIIKAPVIRKNFVFEDFARCVGATVIEDTSGINSFKNLPLSVLGTCDKIIVDKEETTLIGIKDISEHVQELSQNEDVDSKVRFTYLCQKTALLKLGSQSPTELTYLRLKAEDAIHSSRLALQDGIVMGGGGALYSISLTLPETVGGKILQKALKTPFLQIIANAEKNPTDILEQMEGEIDNEGFDAKSGTIVDMFESGIVDSVIVVKQAVKNAIGLASTILTTHSFISLPPKSPEQIAAEVLSQRGIRPF